MSDSKKDGVPKAPEPQSYGSGDGWVKGKTGQSVEGTAERESRHDEAFYESNPAVNDDPSIGGKVRETSAPESDPMDDTAPSPRVTGTGSKSVSGDSDQRKSFFRDRDYKP